MEDQIVIRSKFLGTIIERLVEKWAKKKFGINLILDVKTIGAYTENNDTSVHIDAVITAKKNELNGLINKLIE